MTRFGGLQWHFVPYSFTEIVQLVHVMLVAVINQSVHRQIFSVEKKV